MEIEKRPIDPQYLLSTEQIDKFFEQGRQLMIGGKQPAGVAPQSDESQVA